MHAAKKTREIKELNALVKQLVGDKAGLLAENADLADVVEVLIAKIDALEAKNQVLTAEVQTLGALKTSLKANIEGLNRQLAHAKADHTHLEQLLERLNTDTQAQIDRLQTENAALKKLLAQKMIDKEINPAELQGLLPADMRALWAGSPSASGGAAAPSPA